MSGFSSAEDAFLRFVEKNGMLPLMKKGCLIGLSGGADSVLLLLLTERLSKKEGFPLFALHVEHGIRKDEAERDLAFSRSLCASLSVPFFEHRVSVPTLAAERGEGIEETARRVRYDALFNTAKKCGVGAVLTAHHASDHAETVLLNLLRGTGIKGLCGIPAVREENGILVLRPLLLLSREEIESALADVRADYVTDSTNADTAYRRNYVRHKIIPRLRKVNPALERSLLRLSESVKSDADYLDGEAKKAFFAMAQDASLNAEALSKMHPAISYRVLLLLYREAFPEAPYPNRVHTDAFFARLAQGGDFSLPFPSGISLASEGGRVRFLKGKIPFLFEEQEILYGENHLADGGILLLLEKGSIPEIANVYKLSIHRDVSSATINGGLYVRSKRDGDSYRFGGVTHKLKKLFCDAKLTHAQREHTPVLCDGEGILWVPRFGVRDDGVKSGEEKNMTLYYLPPKTLL